MKVMVLGSGGREHALVWKLASSPKSPKIYAVPGNAGTAELAENVDLDMMNFPALGEFAIANGIDMLIVGPEAPLVEGVADYFADQQELAHIKVIGPKKQGAMLEGSKDYCKQFMLRHGIPTGAASAFTLEQLEEGYAFLAAQQPPFVLKADGLAAGKGVIITEDLEDAKKQLKEMLEGKFGAASQQVLVEEYLSGIEISVFVLTDGASYVTLPSAKDYKRIGEGDTGLNTGGMGAISPVPFADEAFMKDVDDRIIRPTIEGLKKDNIDFTGFIFFGLMNTENGPSVIEYNVRMGDPETEVVIPRIKSDLLELFELAGEKRLSEAKVELAKETASTVMMVSGGYPEAYEKGKAITGYNEVDGALVFHAGTKLSAEGEVLTAGGRVMAVTALGKDMEEALAASYQGVEAVSFDKKYFRTDIGFDL